tara:strand:+ start:528 stop:749 length:222 start_codon:yes stop_codon:yes gene_type:complete
MSKWIDRTKIKFILLSEKRTSEDESALEHRSKLQETIFSEAEQGFDTTQTGRDAEESTRIFVVRASAILETLK